MKCYAFDVDETLELSRGPVTFAMLQQLRQEGHIVGLCGNWGLVTRFVNGWHNLFSFINVGVEKHIFLMNLKMYVAADEIVMVGNVFGEKNSLGVVCGSKDSEAAQLADVRFIKEDDFAKGMR